jgi:arylsulfatase A-like enzyme
MRDTQTGELPNVVFLMADDLGWMDTAHYGSDFYETPNVDRLASEGMAFRTAYAANPLCSPTRASLLTGQYPARLGITAPVCHADEERLESALPSTAPADEPLLTPESATRLPHDQTTLSEVLSEAGYTTGHFGKWHLGWEPYDALHHGFDVDIPNTSVPGPGPRGYYGPWHFWPDEDRIGQNIDDAMADVATEFIAEHAADDDPFFCTFWNFNVHTPIEGDLDIVEKYIGKTDPGSPQRHPIYAAMVEKMDQTVGAILEELDEHGIREDTIVVFFSDNGGVDWAPAPPGSGGEIPVTSNAPLRGGKASIYEGGTRVPLVVSWPGEIEPGSETDALVSSVDFFPTLLELLGMDSRPEQHVDGQSFAPVLDGEHGGRDAVFCHFPNDIAKRPQEGPSASLRRDDWKLIRFFHDGPEFDHRYELYDLSTDIGEQTNLADMYPDRVDRLDARLEEYLAETNAVRPEPNPAYDPEGE